MIDKVTPQAINFDVDSRVRPSNQMIDALNIAYEQSYKDGEVNPQLNDFSGDFSTLKPMPSNRSIEDILELDSNAYVNDATEIRIIGSVSDDIFNVIFFFAWSSDVTQMGVWAWDQEGILPGNNIPGSYIKVYCSEKFNFPSDGFVKGDVVHIGQRRQIVSSERNATLQERTDEPSSPTDEPPDYIDPADRADRVRNLLLYFTDNRNEPKKLDVFKVMSMSLQLLEQEYNNDDLLDLICACPRTPQEPIAFIFDNDPEKLISNFTNLPGMQFAYQYIYDDNVESAISAYSKLAIPPAYIQMGAAAGSPFLENRCRLIIDRGTREVKEVRLLVRYGNTGTFRLIDVIEDISVNSPFYPEGIPINYDFYNDRVLVPVSQEKQNAQYSNLPRVAQAQSVVSDRLMYGNYLENYPEVNTSANLNAVYNSTTEQGYNIDLKIKPFINAPKNWENSGVTSGVGNSRIAGYHISLDGIPNGALGAGTFINVSWSSAPDDNFHIYNHHQSFHGTSEQFFSNPDVGEPFTYSPATNGENMDAVNSDGNPISDQSDFVKRGRSTFGKNKGVHFLDDANGNSNYNKWKYQEPTDIPGQYVQNEVDCVYGTSAANPLILKSDALNFNLSFSINWEITSNAQAYIKDVIYHFLTGDVDMPTQNGVPLASLTEVLQNQSTYNIDCGLTGDTSDIKIISADNDERKNLVCAVRRVDENNDFNDASVENQPPIGYFIVNKARVTFGLKAFPNMEGEGGSDTLGVYLGLNLESLTDIDVRTCIPYIPWDHGGYNVGFPNPTNDYQQDNSGGNNFSWGNLFFNFQSQQNNSAVTGWMPPQVINCTPTKWITYDKNYLNTSDPLNIVGDTYWEDMTIPSNNTINSSVGHKNLFLHRPSAIVSFLEVFQDGDLPGQGSYNASLGTNNMGSALFPCMSSSLNRYNCIGILTSPTANVDSLELIHTGNKVSNYYNNYNERFSIVDGEGNLGHSSEGGAADLTVSAEDSTNTGYTVSTLGSVLPIQMFTGHIVPQVIVSLSAAQDTNSIYTDGVMAFLIARAAVLKHLRVSHPAGNSLQNYPTFQLLTSEDYLFDGEGQEISGALPLNYLMSESIGYQSNSATNYIEDVNSNWIEVPNSNSVVSLAGGIYYNRSFKTRANHEFGIVYYDQRGRSGHVNYLGNVYVKGYSNLERGPGANKGRVDIELSLNHYPPRWSTHYQIVYGGNSTIGDFVQYTTGLAFTENTEGGQFDDTVDTDNAIIYVSLGYLQGDNGISYSHAFGAMSKDGSKDLYTYSEGDKLRILRYTGNDGSTIVYPNSDKHEFEIVGVKTMTSNSEENIIHSSGAAVVPKQKTGQFLMLKTNPQAAGFTYADVVEDMPMGDVDYIAEHNFWNNNCIVEIYKPKKVQEYDERLYYEVGEKYDIVIDQSGVKVHGTPNITLQDGDVYWRNIPLNEPEAAFPSGFFQSILQGTAENDGNESKLRFKNYFLESDTFTDTIPGANGKDWGKVKVIVNKAQTNYKRSSICFSDKNNYSARKNSFTMFNASKFNIKDLPNEYGSINYLLNDYDSVFVIQEDKASSIPVNRNIISTAGGDESLVASQKVLGNQKFYQGDYGSDGNPESVTRAEENIYWASKARREVYKWTRAKGIQVISNVGMKSYFNNIFKRALEDQQMGNGRVRVVGGYDALRDEFIISVHNMYDFTNNENFYDFDYDGEYIEYTDPDDDINPDVDPDFGGPINPDEEDPSDPDVETECPELTFTSYLTAIDQNNLQAGDQFQFFINIENNSNALASLQSSDIYPLPPYIDSVSGLWQSGLVLPPGGLVSVIFDCTIPANYSEGDYESIFKFNYHGINRPGASRDCPKEKYDVYLNFTVIPADPDDPVEPNDDNPYSDSDFNQDGQVSTADLLLFLGAFGSGEEGLPQDLDNDNLVAISDLLLFLEEFDYVSALDDIIEDEINDITIDLSTIDYDGNGVIQVQDLITLIQEYGVENPSLIYDVNNDGAVNVQDILLFLNNWGQTYDVNGNGVRNKKR